MGSKLIRKLLYALTAVIVLYACLFAIAFAEGTPFFCSKAVATGRTLEKKQLLSEHFKQVQYKYRTDVEAIDYYASTEETACIFDDGQDVLVTSESGFYLGNVVDESTVKLYAFLQTEYGVRYSRYGYLSLSVYKTDAGYWVLGNVQGYQHGVLYIDLAEGKCYYKSLSDYNIALSTSDRYLMIYTDKTVMVIDRDKTEAQVVGLDGIGLVPYFDSNGIATLIRNSKYKVDDQTYRSDFYKHNDYYYYSWALGTVYSVAYKDYDYVCYADDKSIIVENEFSFDLIQGGSEVWKIAKKDIVNNEMKMFSIQSGVIWQYGNESSYYHTYYIPDRQTLMGRYCKMPTEKAGLAYLKGYSGRYRDFYSYEVLHSLNHTGIFDQLKLRAAILRNKPTGLCIYNQTHLLFYRGINEDMGGDYGVTSMFETEDNTLPYAQRKITY